MTFIPGKHKVGGKNNQKLFPQKILLKYSENNENGPKGKIFNPKKGPRKKKGFKEKNFLGGFFNGV